MHVKGPRGRRKEFDVTQGHHIWGTMPRGGGETTMTCVKGGVINEGDRAEKGR